MIALRPFRISSIEPDDFVGDRLERQRSERLDDGIDCLSHLIDRGRYFGTAQDAGNTVNHVLQGVDDHGGIERIERVRHRIDRRARAFAGRLEGPRDVTLDLIAELGDLRAELVAQIVEPDARDRVSDLGERRLHAHADARELRLDVGGEGARICGHRRDLRLHAAEVERVRSHRSASRSPAARRLEWPESSRATRAGMVEPGSSGGRRRWSARPAPAGASAHRACPSATR